MTQDELNALHTLITWTRQGIEEYEHETETFDDEKRDVEKMISFYNKHTDLIIESIVTDWRF